ncbi:hypothetical protein [Kamptonema formosum]|uniref:hypothetical protein n=1 Tax=Kamptonema formosum TaxID=331992 RepID=UPI002D21BB1C|nr:hypothetical protein [Kamptonema formosum]
MDDFTLAVLYGIVGAVADWIFMAIFRGCDRACAGIPGSVYLRTTIAGLILGAIAAILPLTRYFGYEELESVVTASFSINFL